jgi:competence protein ComEA
MKRNIIGSIVLSLCLLGSYVNASEDISPTKVSEQKQYLVDINQADVEQLMQLKGIGEKKALLIIEYRAQNGPFKSIDDLLNIKGIGDKIINENRTLIKI